MYFEYILQCMVSAHYFGSALTFLSPRTLAKVGDIKTLFRHEIFNLASVF